MPETIYLKNYKKPSFSVKAVELDFQLYDDHALVINRMELERIADGPLYLYGDELELVRLLMNGEEVSKGVYRFEKDDLIIDEVDSSLELEVHTRIYPQNNTKLSGLYRSNSLFCTQCEAEGFRRISFYPDRPDVLAPFKTRITADKKKYPILLSNGNLVDEGDLNDGRHWVLWEDPFKKPSYLFALVAGNLRYIHDKFTTMSGREVDLYIYVEPGNEDKCQHALESLKKSMRWDEEVYGREYDLDRFMIVAVSDFNMGAMENKGLNIFNSKYILASLATATDQDYADIEGVVAHEYFHNWTGNRVTCRDWFQLSLKEGLTVFRDQEFSRDMNSRDVNRIHDVKLLKASQFPEDASAMAHPVRPESYQEINNFYTATVYNKGAEVIRMQHTLLGSEGFRRGMDLYFERHDGQAVTIDDFVAAMEDANKIDLGQFKRWYSQAGTPEIKVDTDFKEGVLSIHMAQSCKPTPECKDKKPFHIPIHIALFEPNGKPIAIEKDILELKETVQTFEFKNLKEKPVLSLLRGFSAPVKIHYERSTEDLLTLLTYETDGFAKWEASQTLALACFKRLLNESFKDWQLPETLIEAYKAVLADKHLDEALKAELLTPPSFEEVIADLKLIDVDKIEDLREFYRQSLGDRLFAELKETYQSLWPDDEALPKGKLYGRRKLRNLCLWFMMKANEDASLAFCQNQFSNAKTMTDQIASFANLVNVKEDSIKNEAIDAFYQQWKSNDLVLDKWFSIQALAEKETTLALVKDLLNHPDFSFKNPNKVRALIGAFSQNPRQFHAKNGEGYAFLSSILEKMDKINPQIAARLATPFTRWSRYDLPRQDLMKKELKTLASMNLSRDLAEVVEKSLQQEVNKA